MVDEHQEYYKGEIVHNLAYAIQRGGAALASVPNMLLLCIQDDLWVERNIQGQIIRYDRNEFRRFIEAPYPEGLSTTIEVIEKLCAGNIEIVDFLAAAKRGNVGRPIKVENSGNTRQLPDSAMNNSTYALNRLRDQSPELHKRVIAGELSPHAAMVEAGFRIKKVAVNMQDPVSAAKTIKKYMDAETIQAFIDELQTDKSA